MWRIVEVLIRAGRGLAAAHRAGLVHRDIKPDNIMVTQDARTFVLNFGLDHSLRNFDELAITENRPAFIGGTPPYMPPEQRAGAAIDGRSDQFAFCVSLYDLRCGRRPFRQKSDQLAEAIARGCRSDATGPNQSPVAYARYWSGAWRPIHRSATHLWTRCSSESKGKRTLMRNDG